MSQENKKDKMSRVKAWAITGGTVVGPLVLLGYGLMPLALIGVGGYAVYKAVTDVDGLKAQAGSVLGSVKEAFGVVGTDIGVFASDMDKKLSQDTGSVVSKTGEVSPVAKAESKAAFDKSAAPQADKPAAVATPAVKKDMKP